MLNNNETLDISKWCDNVATKVKESISMRGVVDTGNLLKSVDCYPEVVSDDVVNVVFVMWDYGYFQDEGVQGANPSSMPKGGIQKAPGSRFKFGSGGKGGALSKSIDGWMVRKGIAPRGMGGKFARRSGLKYVISRSIFLQGLPPRKFFKPIWEKEVLALTPIVAQGLIKDIEQQWYERIKI